MPILAAAFYSICCLLVGLTFLRTLFKRSDIFQRLAPATACASAFILGQGVLANIWLAMGLLAIFNKPLIWAILILAVALGSFHLADLPSRLRQQADESWVALRQLPKIWYPILFLTGVLIAAFGIKSLTNFRLWEDGEAFYFVLPKVMASSHRLVALKNMYASFTQIGLSGEMHYAALMSISGDLSAKFFVSITALSLTQMLLAICTEVGAELLGKIFALGMLFTSTAFTLWLYGGKVEVFSATFGMAAFCWAIAAPKKVRASDLAVIGIFTGLAIMSKLSYIPTLVPGILIVICWGGIRRPLFSTNTARENILITLKTSFIFSFFAGLPALPNLVKNYFLFNEPLAPFLLLHSPVPATNTTPGSNMLTHMFSQAWFTPEDTKHILLTYPLAMVFGKYPMMGGNVSPLILLGSIFVFLIAFKSDLQKEKTMLLTAAATAGVILWMTVAPSVLCPRYLLPTLLVFIPACSLAYEHLFKNGPTSSFKTLRVTTYLAVTAMLCSAVYSISYTVYWDYRSLSGRESSTYPKGVYYPAQDYLNTHSNSGDRVFVDGYFSYYLRPDLLQCMNGGDEEFDAGLVPGGLSTKKDGSLKYYFLHGYRFLLVQKNVSYVFKKFDMAQEVGGVTAERVFNDDTSAVYMLSSADPKLLPHLACGQIKSPAWDIVRK